MQYSAILRALRSPLGSELEQARADLREIFAPESDHQIGRRPPDIAVVVGHRLAQRVRGIHRERSRTDLSERIRSRPSHAPIGAGDRLAKFFNDDRVARRGNRDEFVDRAPLNGFVRVAKFAQSGSRRQSRRCHPTLSIHTRDQAHEIGQFARAKKEVVVMPECLRDRMRDRRQVERATAKLALEFGDRRRVGDKISAQPHRLDCTVVLSATAASIAPSCDAIRFFSLSRRSPRWPA